MNFIYVIFPLIVLFRCFSSGYPDFRILNNFFFRIAAVALYSNRIDEIWLVRCRIQGLDRKSVV